MSFVTILYNTIVVGAGQAGLAMGYYLQKTKKNFLIIDSHSNIGNSWRFRYDSLILFTPKSQSALPGMSLSGDQNSYPTKDEIADYLEEYAQKFNLPVKLNTKVIKATKQESIYHILTDSGDELKTENLIIATGPFQKPYIPNVSSFLSNDIVQVHSAHYKNKSQLNEGTTLVVGGGNSGMQIATELASSKEVFISVGKKPRFLPTEVLSKSIFWWFNVLGISKLTVDSYLGRIVRKNDPIIGKEIKPLIKLGRVKMLPRMVDIKGSRVLFENGSEIFPENIIWATGFRSDYTWIENFGILNDDGLPVHKRGVTKEDGLFFIGLSWQHQRGSALLLGVGDDAKFLLEKL